MTGLTAIICSYNRRASLAGLLASLRRQVCPEGLEILLVDNNSADGTREAAARWQTALPNLRVVFEPQQGLSHARNRGLREAHSPLIAYLDDDALAGPSWARGIVAGFKDRPEVACVGGPVELLWQAGRPTWLPDRYSSLYTELELGPAARFLDEREYLVGANLAFRRNWLLEQGGFAAFLGRRGDCLLSGEEAAVLRRVFETGQRIFYSPRARVQHRVSKQRARRTWLLRRLFWDGATQPLLDSGLDRSPEHYLSQGLVDLRRLARFGLELVRTLPGPAARRFEALGRVQQRLGRLYSHLALSLGRGP